MPLPLILRLTRRLSNRQMMMLLAVVVGTIVIALFMPLVKIIEMMGA